MDAFSDEPRRWPKRDRPLAFRKMPGDGGCRSLMLGRIGKLMRVSRLDSITPSPVMLDEGTERTPTTTSVIVRPSPLSSSDDSILPFRLALLLTKRKARQKLSGGRVALTVRLLLGALVGGGAPAA